MQYWALLRVKAGWLALLFYCLSACFATSSPPAPPTATATALPPTVTATAEISCVTVDAAWGQQWEIVIETLTLLRLSGVSCGGGEPLASKQYAAHYSYAVALEAQGETEAAIAHYEAAFALDRAREEALAALERLGHLPPPPPVACNRPPIAIDPALHDTPTVEAFVSVAGNRLQLQGEPYVMRGVNYYPRHAPWAGFLTTANPTEMAEELTLIQEAGLNTIRIFLHYDVLFTCAPELAIPNEENFARVDQLLQLARERNLRVLMTLNDLPDLRFRPLYTDWARYDSQTVYIVRRYRHDSTILAWDLRNEGDLDYGARPGDNAGFTQSEVLDWLAHTSALVRQHDPHHLLTAGWWGDPALTAPYVDFVSFHHWSNADELAARLQQYGAAIDKPMVLEEIGYHSWAEAAVDARTESAQAQLLEEALTAAEGRVAGWLVWSAFDFFPPEGGAPHYEHHFGLWRVDGSAKAAVEVLRRAFANLKDGAEDPS